MLLCTLFGFHSEHLIHSLTLQKIKVLPETIQCSFASYFVIHLHNKFHHSCFAMSHPHLASQFAEWFINLKKFSSTIKWNISSTAEGKLLRYRVNLKKHIISHCFVLFGLTETSLNWVLRIVAAKIWWSWFTFNLKVFNKNLGSFNWFYLLTSLFSFSCFEVISLWSDYRM